jgi:SMI1 / KNR4 family (SUKH-1)
MDLELIRRRWQALGLPVRGGLSPKALQDFERRHHVRLPADLESFYRYMDGIEFGSTDEALFCFWPLSQVGPVLEKLAEFRGIPDYGGIEASLPEAASYFLFADHSIWVYVYAIRLSADPTAPAPVLWIADGQTWAPLAASFQDFLERYAADPWSVLAP